ncbi:bifunctional hydroxymethylpyrimidine kinase/phosphomethylpyrimidine kinase [Sphingomonas lacunae]|uniref:hydroxymethylpyrimidine kinase n=1 Tax=Sphingomonas lacunae TaxID=2698828 RepID=A0A6M4AY97_9SPHN|nr:bifunctional hydroxymethylpyrimidine kinase/phosphomethylpyrimidine kinase [Sphingomonas lacunae]QJQ33352.1 bifunctional hydroxymethylpyrimidine kinase/phosphomethylpyrimidine kinase [Sphingomonas lacunae]
MTPRILIIAGSDSGGGAGIQADIKTVTMLGGHAMTAITAITAQNTLGVQGVHAIPTGMVIAQIDSVVADIGVDAIKIGMIGSVDTLNAVAARLSAPDLASVPLVFDPVMVATSGSSLADEATIAAFGPLMDRATVVTPNLPELAALGGDDAVLAHGCALLAKGGHSDDELITDHLLAIVDGEKVQLAAWQAPRINTTSTHGTGCTLASAIATGLGDGLPLEAAVARARDFVRLALHNAPGLGQGHGPMGHASVRNDGLFTGPALNQITLAAADYDQSVAFYRQLGLTQIVDSPDNGYARFEAANGVTLSIHVGEGAPGATTYLESGALDAWCAYLSRRGVRFDHQPRDEEWGWREARLTDPAGNEICLYQAAEYRRFPPWRV